MQGVYLSDATIWDWVNSATRDVHERANAVEAVSSFQRECGGRVTLHGLEQRFNELMGDESLLFTKYTMQYMLQNPPEEFSS
ncbi:MAG: hypothetical protein NUV56_00140 [Candidatus Uhrbacteria bacterium]|nr:hypothetical protein [Candidatus Uhrbacteria bacterium]